jgi:uncharacterized protein (DUF885 family)
LALIASPAAAPPQSPDSAHGLEKLAGDFWAWRARYAPFTGDDVPRIEHPGGQRDWSPASIEKRREDLAEFERRLRAINSNGWPVPEQVDYRLIGSAFARVRWELDINPRWKRDPNFYIEQTVTPILEFIAIPGPYDSLRSKELLTRIKNVPPILASAQQNLSGPPAPFVKAAIDALSDIRKELQTMARSIQPITTLEAADFDEATKQAAQSLESFRTWLQKILAGCPQNFAIGRQAYEFFLYKVALIPHSIEELRVIGRQETERALALEALEELRNRNVAPLRILPTTEAWVQRWTEDEAAIRRFLQEHEIVTVPTWVGHYTLRPIPEYVKALSAFGETDDFTSATRLQNDATRFVDAPSADLDFFWKATAMDPRPILLHEGLPGHYLQLALSWANKDPIRRHFYDSSPPEGIGYYSEEMMLQSGLFDDSPHTREIVYQFMVLRAMGIEIDIKMALGEFTIQQAAAYLEGRLPLGHSMAVGGATTFATWPGVFVGYQTGKSDILRFLADAKLKQGDAFRLRNFHDFLWTNGNVPFALQRWEYLGLSDELDTIDKLSQSLQ